VVWDTSSWAFPRRCLAVGEILVDYLLEMTDICVRFVSQSWGEWSCVIVPE